MKEEEEMAQGIMMTHMTGQNNGDIEDGNNNNGNGHVQAIHKVMESNEIEYENDDYVGDGDPNGDPNGDPDGDRGTNNTQDIYEQAAPAAPNDRDHTNLNTEEIGRMGTNMAGEGVAMPMGV